MYITYQTFDEIFCKKLQMVPLNKMPLISSYTCNYLACWCTFHYLIAVCKFKLFRFNLDCICCHKRSCPKVPALTTG